MHFDLFICAHRRSLYLVYDLRLNPLSAPTLTLVIPNFNALVRSFVFVVSAYFLYIYMQHVRKQLNIIS